MSQLPSEFQCHLQKLENATSYCPLSFPSLLKFLQRQVHALFPFPHQSIHQFTQSAFETSIPLPN